MGLLRDQPILTSKKSQQQYSPDSEVDAEYWDTFRDLPFWCREWATEYAPDDTPVGTRCCFNHYVGLPEKHNNRHPLYDYEKRCYDTLFHIEHDVQDKHVCILKSGGLGITEFYLRLMAWLCLKDDFYKTAQMAVITAPNIDLAVGLIHRLKKLFPLIHFDMKETLCILNGCEIIAYPSHNLHAIRSLTRLAFCLLDEADFFHINEAAEARAVMERYIPKSDPFLAVVSTPNVPGNLMQQILDEPEAVCLYHKILLPYTAGLYKIYTPDEITRSRASPHFEREMNLQFGIGKGNIFPYEMLYPCVQDFDLTLREGFKVLAVDPAYGSSKFAIVGAEVLDGIIYIKEAVQFERPSPIEMTMKLIELAPKYRKNVVIDSAHPGLITDLNNAGINADPVKFNQELSDMTLRAAEKVKQQKVLIHKGQKDLVSQLRSVQYNDKGHPNKKEMTFDLGDAFLMSVYYCDIGDFGFVKMPSD